MTYENGILKKSTRKGNKAFTKTYEYDADGKISKLVKDGREVNTAEKRKLTKRILDEAHEREIQKEALERTREARNTETKAQEFQERIFKNVDKSTQKSAEESANVLDQLLDEKYKQEALERANAKVAAKELEEKAQKEYFSRVDKTGGKVARESARNFMTPEQKLFDILDDDTMPKHPATSKKNMTKRAQYLEKYLKPEALEAMQDESIRALLVDFIPRGGPSYKEIVKTLNATPVKKLKNLTSTDIGSMLMMYNII